MKKSDPALVVAIFITLLVLGLFIATAKSGGSLCNPDYNPYPDDTPQNVIVPPGLEDKTISYIEGELEGGMSSDYTSLTIIFTDGSRMKIEKTGKHSLNFRFE